MFLDVLFKPPNSITAELAAKIVAECGYHDNTLDQLEEHVGQFESSYTTLPLTCLVQTPRLPASSHQLHNYGALWGERERVVGDSYIVEWIL